MIVWLLLAASVLWAVAYRYRRRRLYALASKIPGGAYERPLTGIAHMFIGSTEDIMSSVKDLSYSSIVNNGMIKGWLGHVLYFMATDPVDIEVVLKNCLEKDIMQLITRKLFGNGGIFAPVSIWRPRRKIMVPAFTPKVVESFVPILAEQSMKLASKVGEQAGGDRFRLWPFISSYALDSVCETALGIKMNAEDDKKAQFLVEMNKVLESMCKLIPLLLPDSLYKLLPDYYQKQKSINILHGFTNDVITKKRVELKTKQAKNPEAEREFDFSSYANKTFLDLLIQLSSGGEKGYSNLELREEIFMLIVAATDTSATAIGYALKMMAKYPDVQEKVLQELDEVYGDSDRLFEKEDLARLKYLERVIKETLRLFPPVPFLIRKVEEEITLPSGRVLPAGSGVLVSIWGTHRNPKYWGSNAEKFDPDRFLPERFNLKHPCAFLPFSNGPRNCVGFQYALMSIKAAMSSMLRYHRVVSDPETKSSPQIRVKLAVMMKAVDGYEVALQMRRPLPKLNLNK